MSNRAAFICGLADLALSARERRFLAETRPAGLILFARNLESHDQIRRLVGEARSAIGGDDTLVLIDQEGGRVQRLRPPLGRGLPPAAAYAALYAEDAGMACRDAHLAARLLADDLKELGIDTDCAPVLDLPVAGAHEIIGDRAYGDTVAQVVALGRTVAEGLIAGGVLPVVKHIPGHGRATCDSHLALPVVATARSELEESDFATFQALAHMPAAMTAHVIFSAIDDASPASTSATITAEIIRGHIGFDGLLMSDDLGMKALVGPMRARAEAVIAAGSDLALHCSGDFAEMQAVAAGVPALSGLALRRFEISVAVTRSSAPYDRVAAEMALAGVLARHDAARESV
ncbi:MAG: beta-N-acetylhexosaminidase [Hyphomicrobiaceae bacterium]